MNLYREHGFAETTVAEIAARAGLTERTFFRYFADKREVLFWGAPLLERSIVEGIAAAPADAAPLEAVVAALAAAGAVFEERREGARVRHALIQANAELREREVMKLTSLGAAIAAALRARGVREPGASLTAEAGIAIFKVGFERWLEDAGRRDFAHHLRAALGELRGVVAEQGAAARRAPRTARAAGRGRRSPAS
ncbi:TetR family transcriptional regulator [Anaeromyxobacter paludicola]|uniref:TetR family transcriptional regulator n=2 Tax=Anaeromyxobacter paludicola TaxID=2918171 RepID=A0ABM7XFV6_9BACT|nr:TetR family transcriptional regulator [Anaeromyxobacter paludicola]